VNNKRVICDCQNKIMKDQKKKCQQLKGKDFAKKKAFKKPC
jgi:hypothetical protein